jgi:hypothetical protein
LASQRRVEGMLTRPSSPEAATPTNGGSHVRPDDRREDRAKHSDNTPHHLLTRP